MNNFSLSVVTMMHYNTVVRDTLEYVLNRPQYGIDAYNYKKKALMVEVEQPTALKQFLDKNKEIGEKVTKLINELYALMYADDSTICKVANNELRVDQGQHLAVYEVVLPLHEEIKRIIEAHLNFARKNNLFEDDLMKLVIADERMYRGVAFTCLYRDLEKLFVEYNKARNEAKGGLTPQSNFIQGELIKVVNQIKFVKDNQSATDNEYWDVVDYVMKTVDQTGGRRQLPQGKTFKDIFEEGKKLISAYLQKAETTWKSLYEAAVKELAEKSHKAGGQLKVNVNNPNNPSTPNNDNKEAKK